jgi:hypothetical protein
MQAVSGQGGIRNEPETQARVGRHGLNQILAVRGDVGLSAKPFVASMN